MRAYPDIVLLRECETKYPNFTFFQHFYILTMVNHVKDDQKPVSGVQPWYQGS